MNCKKAKEISLALILKKINATEKKKIKNQIWYLSPFRNEHDASFKIDIIKNLWYDFGLGRGGNVLDFVMLYYKCNIKEALNILDNNSFSFHQQDSYLENLSGEKNNSEFKIVKIQNLQNHALINYLKSRKISYEIARLYCFEVYYKNKDKRYFSIGFKNDSGGLELRNKYFKGCYDKKDITTIKNDSSTLNIFEGFMDFLSWFHLKISNEDEDFLILNSLSMADNIQSHLGDYDLVNLYLDNDNSGKELTKKIIRKLNSKCLDCSTVYKDYKDLNDYLISKNINHDVL